MYLLRRVISVYQRISGSLATLAHGCCIVLLGTVKPDGRILTYCHRIAASPLGLRPACDTNYMRSLATLAHGCSIVLLGTVKPDGTITGHNFFIFHFSKKNHYISGKSIKNSIRKVFFGFIIFAAVKPKRPQKSYLMEKKTLGNKFEVKEKQNIDILCDCSRTGGSLD